MIDTSNKEIQSHYDFIVVGGGAAGSVLAAELSASGAQVLVIESGGPDDAPTIANPSVWFYNVGGPLDYHLPVKPSPRLNNRKFNMALGHVLGGGSSINAMVWMRGMQRDYDGWAETGAKGWAFADVLPVFKAQEDWEGGANAWRGAGGPIHIRRPRDPHPIAPAFIDAAREMGMPILDDVNGPMLPGAGYINMNIAADGTRVSAARAFLRPALSRPNLTLLLNTNVVKLNFKGTRCVGVKLNTNGAVKDIAADKEVILAAGTINSPKLLMLSGVGEAKALRSFGIDVVENLPGVGENLQDHVLVSGVVFKYKGKMPDRPADSNGVEAEAYLSSGPSGSTDISLVLHQLPVVTPEVASRFGTPPADAFTIAPPLVQPTSIGSIRLASGNFQDGAVIDGNYLGTEHDFAAVVRAIEAARELGNQHAFDSLLESELIPGPKRRGGPRTCPTCLGELWTRSWHVQNGCGQSRCCRPRASRARHCGFTRGGRLRDAMDHYGAGDQRVDPHDCRPRRQADSRLTTGDRMTSNPDKSLTIRRQIPHRTAERGLRATRSFISNSS